MDNHQHVHRLYHSKGLHLRSLWPKRNRAAAHPLRLLMNRSQQLWRRYFVCCKKRTLRPKVVVGLCASPRSGSSSMPIQAGRTPALLASNGLPTRAAFSALVGRAIPTTTPKSKRAKAR
jgi:hypothetical protein